MNEEVIPVEPLRELTDKEAAFCEEYAVDKNGTRAILRAGYDMSEASAATEAWRLLRKPEIKLYLDDLLSAQAERTKVTADYVILNLKEIVERCMQRAPVMIKRGRHMVQMVDEDGNNVWRFDAMGANAAIEKIGKHLKMFTDKHEHSGPDGKPIETVNKSDLTDEQLTEKIKLLSIKVEDKE